MKHLAFDGFDDDPKHRDYTTFEFHPGRRAADFFTTIGLEPKTVSAEPIEAIDLKDKVFMKYTGLHEVSRQTWDTAVAAYKEGLDG